MSGEELLDEWVAKAEGDYYAGCLLRNECRPATAGVIAFHAQQCAEKYLNALLIHLGEGSTRNQDLRALLAMCLTRLPQLSALEEDCVFLGRFGLETLYPGQQVNRKEADAALAACYHVRELAREALNLWP